MPKSFGNSITNRLLLARQLILWTSVVFVSYSKGNFNSTLRTLGESFEISSQIWLYDEFKVQFFFFPLSIQMLLFCVRLTNMVISVIKMSSDNVLWLKQGEIMFTGDLQRLWCGTRPHIHKYIHTHRYKHTILFNRGSNNAIIWPGLDN